MRFERADITEPTAHQERVFEAIQRQVPEGTVFDVEAFGDILIISFDFDDPRPSRSGLADAGFTGHVFVGPRGGVKSFHAWSHDFLFGSNNAWADRKFNTTSTREFLFALGRVVRFGQHGFFA